MPSLALKRFCLLGNYGNAIPFYGSEFAQLGKMNPVPLVVYYTKSLRQLQCFIWNFERADSFLRNHWLNGIRCIIFQRDVLQNRVGQHFGLGNVFSFEKMPLLGFLLHWFRKHEALSPAEGRGLGEATTAVQEGGEHRPAGSGWGFYFFKLYSASSPANDVLC